MKNHQKRETCRLCESKKLKLVLPLKPTPIADNYISSEQLKDVQPTYPLDLYLCLDCGHAQLLDIVDPAAIFRDYLYVTSSSLGLVEHFRQYVDQISALVSFPNQPLTVEIGSNDGTFLRFFKEKGYKVLGIDPARDIARKASDKGIETWPEFFTSELAKRIRTERGPAAIMAANNVFAHSDHMGDMVDGIRELLQKDGIFVFEVAYLGDMLQKRMFDTMYHEHLSYHSVQPLERFLRRHGLELIQIDRTPSKAGSLRCMAQHQGGPRKIHPSVAEMLASERKMNLDKPEPFLAMAKAIEKTREDLTQKIQKIKAEKKIVVGYGASPSVTTLIYYFGLQSVLDYLVDDNPLKQGRFSPGSHLPIYPSAVLTEKKPDFVVLLAWTYAKPITERNKAYQAQGGKFIVPLPELQVL